jgi:hypothetical protein
LDVLRNFAPRCFVFNRETIELLEKFHLSKKVITRLSRFEQDKPLGELELNQILDELKLGPKQRNRVLEASAILAIHIETEIPVIKLLVCDDAPQFKLITDEVALCWIHEGRHYKKLNPVVPTHQEKLEEFRKEYWEYYRKLEKFKENPLETTADKLSEEFDLLFGTQTAYENLDNRIVKTKDKKEELLTVLRHPELPLHNNDAELGARVQVRDR